MAKIYHKLVRDKIPDIIASAGKACETAAVTGQEYLELLELKLNEELEEYLQSKSMEELADLLEVIRAVAAARGSSMEEVEAIRRRKADERGGFEKGVLLLSVREAE